METYLRETISECLSVGLLTILTRFNLLCTRLGFFCFVFLKHCCQMWKSNREKNKHQKIDNSYMQVASAMNMPCLVMGLPGCRMF